MKITASDYEALRECVRLGAAQIMSQTQYLAQGYSAERYRWDALWSNPRPAAGQNYPASAILDRCYEYANDSHIDTALRKAVKELGL